MNEQNPTVKKALAIRKQAKKKKKSKKGSSSSYQEFSGVVSPHMALHLDGSR
jgi:hypothetical protein